MKKPFAVRCVAALYLFVLISILPAQNAKTGQVVITVVDRSGTIIPGAHVGIIGLPSTTSNDGDWQRYALHASEQVSAETDASGKTILRLAKGSYVANIAAVGFNRYLDKIVIRDEQSQTFRAELFVAGTCSPCLTVAPEIEIPLERVYLPNLVIPLEPLQMVTLPVRFRRRLGLWSNYRLYGNNCLSKGIALVRRQLRRNLNDDRAHPSTARIFAVRPLYLREFEGSPDRYGDLPVSEPFEK